MTTRFDDENYRRFEEQERIKRESITEENRLKFIDYMWEVWNVDKSDGSELWAQVLKGNVPGVKQS